MSNDPPNRDSQEEVTPVEQELGAQRLRVYENQEVDSLRRPELETTLSAELDRASQPYIGRWNHLISTTNWEKGRIILQWREELKQTGAPSTEYSDEAWAVRVGGLTGQHAGRLRRVYQRFGSTQDSFKGLYWSHFHAAIDWDDAEMWLEGAVQNQWSVSQMRTKRWDTLGRTDEQPRDEDIVASELDEDYEAGAHTSPAAGEHSEGPRHDGPDFGEEPLEAVGEDSPSATEDDQLQRVERVQPFENLDELPDDLQEAFDHFKLAILHHKDDNWEEISCQDVLSCLEALKQLALAPSE